MNLMRMTFELLSARSKKILFFIVLPLSICNSIATLLSIGVLMPIMNLVINPNLSQTNDKLNWIYSHIHFQDINSFVIFFGFTVLTILISANLMTILLNYILMKFCKLQKTDLTKRLFDFYLSKDYLFFVGKNSSTLVKNIFEDVNVFIYHVLMSQVTIFTQTILVLFIFSLLIYVSVLITFAILIVLGGMYLFVFQMQKSKLNS